MCRRKRYIASTPWHQYANNDDILKLWGQSFFNLSVLLFYNVGRSESAKLFPCWTRFPWITRSLCLAGFPNKIPHSFPVVFMLHVTLPFAGTCTGRLKLDFLNVRTAACYSLTSIRACYFNLLWISCLCYSKQQISRILLRCLSIYLKDAHIMIRILFIQVSICQWSK